MKRNKPAKRYESKTLYTRIQQIIESARNNIARAVNFEIAHAYWLIGREIIEEEQKGKNRAEYGKKVIEELSKRLTGEYGAGWSPSHLWHIRQFHLIYRDRKIPIMRTRRAESNERKILHTLRAELSWSHYRILMRIENPQARSFYEIECAKNNWSSRELERQKGSMLFERLALSKDKKAVRRLAFKGQEINRYEDMIKDPYVLEFTGLSQMYVNCYDRKMKQPDDNPTVGLLLCEDKKDAVVHYTLSENSQQIFASRYKLYLPTEEELRQELVRERKLMLKAK